MKDQAMNIYNSKRLTVLFILLMVSSIAFTQTSDSDIKRNSGFKKLSFEFELNKNNYLPFEPLFVKFRLSNQTKTPLAADRPQFLHDSVLKVMNFRGESKEITNLTLTSSGGPLLPGPIPILQPLQSYEEEEKVPVISSDVFAEPGKYQIQFLICGIESNVIEITVNKPLGIDKEAFDFLNKHGKDVWFGNIFLEKDGLALMEIFVNRYAQSGYGELAIYQLGLRYFYTDQLDPAQREFEKIKTSSNKLIAETAKKSLADIEKRLKEKL